MITAVIPTSPTVTCPDTSIIERCIDSVRSYLPDCRIIVTCDGIRPELEHHRSRYAEFIGKLAMDQLASDFKLVAFPNHHHQSGMMAYLLHTGGLTDQIFYVEHDWELVGEIPFKEMSQLIASGEADLIRLLYPTELPPYYSHMMIDQAPILRGGIPLVRTFQWSQNPHLASLSFYQKIFSRHFDRNWGFIEEKMTAPMLEDHNSGRDEYRTFIYVPEGNTQRVNHLDARKGENQNF